MANNLIKAKELGQIMVEKGFDNYFNFFSIDGNVEFVERSKSGFLKIDQMLAQKDKPCEFYLLGFPIFEAKHKPYVSMAMKFLYDSGEIRILELNINFISEGTGHSRDEEITLINPNCRDIPSFKEVYLRHRETRPQFKSRQFKNKRKI